MTRSDAHYGKPSGPPKLAALLTVALLAGLGSYAYADFGPAQGGGGGAAQTPWSTDIDGNGKSLTGVLNFSNTGTTTLGNGAGDTVSLGSTNVLAFGGTSSTFPALRYGSSAGVIQALLADGSAGNIQIRPLTAGSVLLATSASDGSYVGICDDNVDVYAQVEKGANLAATRVVLAHEEEVAVVGSSGLTVPHANGLAFKDQTSAPTVTAGYGGVYSLNTNGLQQLVTKGGSGAVTLATQGYYAAGGWFQVAKTADQTFTNAGETVTWDTEDADQPGGVDVSGANTRIFTAPAAGTVTLWVKVRWAADADTADPWTLIFKRFNSAGVAGSSRGDRQDSTTTGNASSASFHFVTITFRMAAGDYLTMQGFVTGAASVNFDDAGNYVTTAALCNGLFVPD